MKIHWWYYLWSKSIFIVNVMCSGTVNIFGCCCWSLWQMLIVQGINNLYFPSYTDRKALWLYIYYSNKFTYCLKKDLQFMCNLCNLWLAENRRGRRPPSGSEERQLLLDIRNDDGMSFSHRFYFLLHISYLIISDAQIILIILIALRRTRDS